MEKNKILNYFLILLIVRTNGTVIINDDIRSAQIDNIFNIQKHSLKTF
jgi:hypothetical protein